MAGSTGIILAGGRGERFGAYKATVILAGKPLILWPMMALEGLVQETLIAHGGVGRRRALEALGIRGRYVEDPEGGPLGGLLEGTKVAKGEWIVVAPSDMPLVSRQLFEALLSGAMGVDACVPRFGGRENPVLGVYRRATLRRTALALREEGESSALALLGRLRVQFIEEETLERMPFGLDCLLDVDTPGDLAKAAAMILSSGRAP